ncbi:alpha/beta fold hydrolase [Paenibacillus harenae]|uniref:alpha/beta fold hydrolase n=1 Tax=Paenibacillus harenae TaxID=306543 RepID=UPI002791F6F6|nr:alpha/beta hydrolase [Paenibacillus harenae]MDQ0061698.1 pimeloyl-ACP methyl ester carboxylesterase [Paenibacillus harenae]
MTNEIKHQNAQIEDINIFYRESGPADAPAILLLHGFPTSSHMFRHLIPLLSEKYHVIAPDLPGFGFSSALAHDQYEYSFDGFSLLLEKLLDGLNIDGFYIYLMDYGAPTGFRIAARHPERIKGLIIQNGNAYDEGLADFWNPIKEYWNDPANEEKREALRWLTSFDATKWQYTHGVERVELVSPDTYTFDQSFLDRPGNQEIQLDLFLNYGTNPALYPKWQEYFRKDQPPTLIVWGKGDEIFPASGAYPYLRDLPNAEFHLFEDAGHFALETHLHQIAGLMIAFMDKNN